MLNQDKYTTPEERVKAFEQQHCEFYSGCKNCPYETSCNGYDGRTIGMHIMAHWLSLEAEEEKPEPCPFCHKEVVVGFSGNIHKENYRQVWCSDCERCGYECVMKKTEADAIAAHNRVARAVREANNNNN